MNFCTMKVFMIEPKLIVFYSIFIFTIFRVVNGALEYLSQDLHIAENVVLQGINLNSVFHHTNFRKI